MVVITYPGWANTIANKWLYCRRMKNRLQKLHNLMGDWFRDGITQTQYGNFPNKVKNRYDFASGEKLSQAQWNDFNNLWDSFSNAVWAELHTIRQQAEDDDTSDVDIDRDIS